MNKVEGDEFYLYFIVRSVLMSVLGTGVFSVILSFLRMSKPLYVLASSLASFFIVLFITRMFDGQTKRLVELFLERLNGWPRAKDFLLENF